MTTAHASRWRERRGQRPTSNVARGQGAVAPEVLWCNRPLLRQARLLEPEAVCSL
jgi:hypothetical protein